MKKPVWNIRDSNCKMKSASFKSSVNRNSPPINKND